MKWAIAVIKAPFAALRRFLRWRRKSKQLDDTDPFIYD